MLALARLMYCLSNLVFAFLQALSGNRRIVFIGPTACRTGQLKNE